MLTPEAPPPITKLITLAEGMTVKDLADKLEIKVTDVLKKLMDRRMMLTINSTLDAPTAQLIARGATQAHHLAHQRHRFTRVSTCILTVG